MNTLLSCQQLDLQPAEHLLVKQLTLDIQANQCWVILGPNGAGKSSLLHALAGLLPAHASDIQLQQRPLADYPAKQRARYLGLLLQQSTQHFPQTVLDMVLGGLFAHKPCWQWHNSDDKQVALDALQKVGLRDQHKQLLPSLSGGELRRAEIARLLLQNPSLALLDEPLNHLDIGQQVALLARLQQHFQNAQQALVLVLHDINLARQIASHMLLLFGDGHWLAGRCEEVCTPTTMSRLFGHPVLTASTPQGELFSADYRLLHQDVRQNINPVDYHSPG